MKSLFKPLTESPREADLKALLFLTLGSKYLNLVHNALEESVKSGNLHIIVSDGELSWEDYYKKTKWSDFFIIEPVLFSFYHGLELTIKGLLFLTGSNDVEATHEILILYKKLTQVENLPKDIIDVMKRYVTVSGDFFISDFLTENNKNIDDLYESLRYPTDKKLLNLNSYIKLHYHGKSGIKQYEEILKDIRKLQAAGTIFYRTLSVK